ISLLLICEKSHFDPGTDCPFVLLVRPQTGTVDGVFTSFELGYQLPEVYFERPPLTAAELAAIEEASSPLWLNIWYQKSFQIGILITALGVLLVILFLQDYFTSKPAFLHWLRRGYLLFTVF